jgi:hypothetical protein
MALAVSQDELNSAASRLVSELPQMRNLGKEEAQAHIGLLSHGNYYYNYGSNLSYYHQTQQQI